MTGDVIVDSTSLLDIGGPYTVNVFAALVSYPAIPAARDTVDVTIVDPCLTTTLALPTALTAFDIAMGSGIGHDQTFLPAIDTAALNSGITNLCGPRKYVILEAQPSTFMTISSPGVGLEYTDPWTLSALSNNLLDVGTWPTITLQASLVNYPLVTPATQVISNAIVRNACGTSLLNPTTLPASIDYQLTFANPSSTTVASFTMNTDSEGVL